jgi:hypothetical protein
MRTRSKKAKGRRLQNWVRDELLKRFPSLNENDVLSDKAKKSIPFAIECKNQEAFKKLYKDYGQAEYNAKNLEPVVFLKMNQCKPLVVIDAEYFLDWIKND